VRPTLKNLLWRRPTLKFVPMCFQRAAPQNRQQIFQRLRFRPEDSGIQTASVAKANRENRAILRAWVPSTCLLDLALGTERVERAARKEWLRVQDSATAWPL